MSDQTQTFITSRPSVTSEVAEGLAEKLVRGFSSANFQSRRERLVARIDALRARATGVYRSKYLEQAEVISLLLDRAEIALDKDKIEIAWRVISEAEREEMFLVDERSVLARAVAIEQEAKINLPADAQVAIAALVGRAFGAKDGDAGANRPSENVRELVGEALRFYDKWMITLFNRAERVNGRVFVLTVIMIFLIIYTGYSLHSEPELFKQIFSSTATADITFNFLSCVALLGGIGACFSALISFTFQNRAPSDFEGWMVTIARPVIGFTSGSIITLAAFGNVIDLKSKALLTLLAFAAGFSERLVVGTIERVGSVPDGTAGASTTSSK